ncbi:MAG TPA: heme-binding protein [Xanthobacteraceae bacterium]|nr:heme-binding protein [Xanthobacteraceae bacterium]
MRRIVVAAAAATIVAAAAPGRAEEAIVTYKSLAPDTAFELARAALDQCRKDGYQVAVVVIDRFGAPLVMLRDRYAGLAAPATATGKAWTAVNFSRNTSDLVKAIHDGQLSAGLANLPNVVMLAGGLVIEAGGALVGGVGVAGAPGGEKDEACAKAGLDKVRDRLDF